MVAVLALVLLGVVLAVLKPWAALEEPVPTRRPAASSIVAIASPRTEPPPTASPTPVPLPSDPRGFRCLGGRHWTLVTDEAQGPRELRAWIRIDPLVGATGPDDPAIPWTRVGADAVRAIGVCLPGAPSTAGATPGPDAAGTTIVVRRQRDSASTVRGPWVETQVLAWAGTIGTQGGAMVAPGGDAAGGPWPLGDYIVEVRPGYVGPSAWFGLRVAGPTVGSGAGGVPASAAPSLPDAAPAP